MIKMSLIAVASLFAFQAHAKNPVVELTTSAGTIVVELDEEKAPVSTKNFMEYVSAKFYDGTVFHRVIKDFMVQGGGFVITGGKLTKKDTKAPIKIESNNGLKNMRGTLAMARTMDPNSATSQFFINHKDNDFLNYQSDANPGYAVFGKVLSGMDVVDKIATAATGFRDGMQDVPTADVVIVSVVVKADAKPSAKAETPADKAKSAKK